MIRCVASVVEQCLPISDLDDLDHEAWHRRLMDEAL